MLSVKIKYFNALMNYKLFFDQHIKYKQEANKIFVEVLRNNDYATENLLDNLNWHTIFIISLALNYQNKKNSSILQQVNFTGKLEEDDGVTVFFIAKKQQTNILNFSLDSLT